MARRCPSRKERRLEASAAGGGIRWVRVWRRLPETRPCQRHVWVIGEERAVLGPNRENRCRRDVPDADSSGLAGAVRNRRHRRGVGTIGSGGGGRLLCRRTELWNDATKHAVCGCRDGGLGRCPRHAAPRTPPESVVFVAPLDHVERVVHCGMRHCQRPCLDDVVLAADRNHAQHPLVPRDDIFGPLGPTRVDDRHDHETGRQRYDPELRKENMVDSPGNIWRLSDAEAWRRASTVPPSLPLGTGLTWSAPWCSDSAPALSFSRCVRTVSCFAVVRYSWGDARVTARQTAGHRQLASTRRNTRYEHSRGPPFWAATRTAARVVRMPLSSVPAVVLVARLLLCILRLTSGDDRWSLISG